MADEPGTRWTEFPAGCFLQGCLPAEGVRVRVLYGERTTVIVGGKNGRSAYKNHTLGEQRVAEKSLDWVCRVFNARRDKVDEDEILDEALFSYLTAQFAVGNPVRCHRRGRGMDFQFFDGTARARRAAQLLSASWQELYWQVAQAAECLKLDYEREGG